MDSPEDPDKPRHSYGPRAVGAVLPAVTRAAFRRRAPAAAQVLADWPAIVGPALAAVTLPRRMAGGTLTIACAGPTALELQHRAAALIERINVHLGHALVERLRFTQEAVEITPAVAASPRRDLAAQAAAARAVADLPEGSLREALARLGEAVLTRR